MQGKVDKNNISSLTELEEETLRKYIRELMLGADVQEHDALLSKTKQWKDESSDLRKDMIQLLRHIQDDEYDDGVEKIDQVVKRLNIWKTKINKYLS